MVLQDADEDFTRMICNEQAPTVVTQVPSTLAFVELLQPPTFESKWDVDFRGDSLIQATKDLNDDESTNLEQGNTDLVGP